MAKMSLAVAGTLEELVITSILSRMSVTIRRLLTCADDENKGHAQDYCDGGWSVGTASNRGEEIFQCPGKAWIYREASADSF